MHEVIVITIIHHSDGKYRVYKDLGAMPEVAGAAKWTPAGVARVKAKLAA
jgi:hypothetical protein